MQGEPPNQASAPAAAVFLSYASEDVEAAKRICEALRAGGIEVWFDQSELRGGDAWDQSIRKQIKACALFVPIISRHTHDRIEGYFRLEWKLAVDRSHLIAPDQPFLLPVAIDDTPQGDERIPDRFRDLQWTRLPAGETTSGFIDRVRRVLLHDTSSSLAALVPISPARTAHISGGPRAPLWRSMAVRWMAGAVLALPLAYIAVKPVWTSKHALPTALPSQTGVSTPAAFSPPPHSLAVLPLVNMSADKEQEYFSDGLSEELLNALSRIGELQVAARTSSFYFKGEHADLSTIAHKLNVASILEGSVRRSGHTLRVTAQLTNAVTGFHLWSQTYDRDLTDVLAMQTEIANAVASALKVTLLGDVASKVELGGTRNPGAFDAYLRAGSLYYKASTSQEHGQAIGLYTEAIRLDPNYALAFAARSILWANMAWLFGTGSEIRSDLDRARADAKKAISLAPELAESHLALAIALEEDLDFDGATKAYNDARLLAPRNSRVERNFGTFSVLMGRAETGIAAARHAVAIDPLDRDTHSDLANVLINSRRYDEAASAYQDAVLVAPKFAGGNDAGGLAYYMLGEFSKSISTCELAADDVYCQMCLALAYQKVGRHSDAADMLEKMRAAMRNDGAYQYARVYAQWGNTGQALEWLETAMRLRSPWLEFLRQDPTLDPLRKERRFQAIQRALKFPD